MSDFKTALEAFLVTAQNIVDANWTARGYTHGMSPILSIDPRGRRYTRIVEQDRDKAGNVRDGTRRVYCFVDQTNGDVLKAEGWKKPAKHARGNIFSAEGGAEGVTAYGGKYLR